ncbi:membrane protein [gamma proteobacterium HTCC5015]|nr:membrane protein [gamma proteobacterium HTCC5015]
MHIESDDNDDHQITTAVYALQALGLVTGGLTFLAGIVINYIKLDSVRGTWLESHYNWQIRSFWFGTLWFLLGGALSSILIGIPILVANFAWLLYRIIRGWVNLSERRPMPV